MVDDRFERLAQAIHEQYLAAQRRSGANGGGSAMVPWAELNADLREANRAQARDIEAKLARIGCTISADDGDGAVFAFTDAEVEMLARAEHERWTAQRTTAGWTYAQTRDDRTKGHPSLVRWDQLSELERDKDRDVIRAIPAVLAAAGLRPRRVATPAQSGSETR
jgi:hypothetical protein